MQVYKKNCGKLIYCREFFLFIICIKLWLSEVHFGVGAWHNGLHRGIGAYDRTELSGNRDPQYDFVNHCINLLVQANITLHR
jgi:hypothetical protein